MGEKGSTQLLSLQQLRLRYHWLSVQSLDGWQVKSWAWGQGEVNMYPFPPNSKLPPEGNILALELIGRQTLLKLYS